MILKKREYQTAGPGGMSLLARCRADSSSCLFIWRVGCGSEILFDTEGLCSEGHYSAGRATPEIIIYDFLVRLGQPDRDCKVRCRYYLVEPCYVAASTRSTLRESCRRGWMRTVLLAWDIYFLYPHRSWEYLDKASVVVVATRLCESSEPRLLLVQPWL